MFLNAIIIGFIVLVHSKSVSGGSFLEDENKIVGGTNVALFQYPFFVQGNGCGASLIHEDIVLTAAHCQGAFGANVLVGPTISKKIRGGAQWCAVTSDMYIHPKNDDFTNDYDFMMFKIAKPTNPNILPVALNTDTTQPSLNQVLTVVGFGLTSTNGRPSRWLKQALVPFVPDSQCQKDYPVAFHNTSMVCAGVGNTDTCQGDSGGPMLSPTGSLVGITSFGKNCAQVGAPGVYARVSSATDWIQQTICKLSDNPPSYCPPPPTTTIVCNATTNTISYRASMQYDQNAFEFGWYISDVASGTNIVKYVAGSVYQANSYISTSAALERGRMYNLVMWDIAGNGMPTGQVQVTALVNGQSKTIVSLPTTFSGTSSVTSFSVPCDL